MGKAARAIIINNGSILVMHRDKENSKYYTLVGGGVTDNETVEDAVVREVKEETGLTVTSSRLVFVEKHPEPYNEQYIYLCTIADYSSSIQLQDGSDEKLLNTMQTNIHTPIWVPINNFKNLAFRTPQLHRAIMLGIEKGFPETPISL